MIPKFLVCVRLMPQEAVPVDAQDKTKKGEGLGNARAPPLVWEGYSTPVS